MREFTDNCIVLKVSDYRDDDKLAKVLSAENGVFTVCLRGVKKAKAKLKPFAQPFAFFNAKFVCGRGAFLTVIDPMIISDGFALCCDLKTYTAASVAAEATLAALGDSEPHADVLILFLKLVKSLQFDGDPYYQSCAYMCELLKISGFYREYTYSDDPKTPVQALGFAQKHGHIKREADGRSLDLSRRALKYVCGEFERSFDIGLKSVESIDLYAD